MTNKSKSAPYTDGADTLATSRRHVSETIAGMLSGSSRKLTANVEAIRSIEEVLVMETNYNKGAGILGRLFENAGYCIELDPLLVGYEVTLGSDIYATLLGVDLRTGLIITAIDTLKRGEQFNATYALAIASAMERTGAWTQAEPIDGNPDGDKGHFPYATVVLVAKTAKGFTVRAYSAGTEADRTEVAQRMLCHVLTHGETYLAMEEERASLLRLSRKGRQKLYERMKSQGVTTLRGKRADIVISSCARRRVTDLERLEREYPEAYRACVSETPGQEYIRIKFHPRRDSDSSTPAEGQCR